MKERVWQICLIIAVIAIQAVLAPGLAKAQGAELQPVAEEGAVPAPSLGEGAAPEPVAADPVAPAPAADDQAFEKLLQQGANSDRSGAEGGADGGRDIVLRGDSETSMGGLWVLFLGAGVVLLVGWGLQHYRKHLSPTAPPDIAHIQSLRLGVKHTISIIEADGRRLLLGLSEGSIALLADLGRDDVAVVAPPVARDWKDVFAQARNQMVSTLEDDALAEGQQVMRVEVAEEPARAPVFAASSSRRAYEAVAAMKPPTAPALSPEVSYAPREELPVAVAAPVATPVPSVVHPAIAVPTPAPATVVTAPFDPSSLTSTGTYRPPSPESYAPVFPEAFVAPVAPVSAAPMAAMPAMPSVPGAGVTMPPVMPLAPMGSAMAAVPPIGAGMPVLGPAPTLSPSPLMAAPPMAMPAPAPMSPAPMPPAPMLSPGAPMSSPIAGSRVRVGIPGAPQTPPGYIGPGVTAVVASRPDRETDGVLAALKAMEARYSGESTKKEGV